MRDIHEPMLKVSPNYLLDFVINIKGNNISNSIPKHLNKDSKRVPIILPKHSKFTIPNNHFDSLIHEIL